VASGKAEWEESHQNVDFLEAGYIYIEIIIMIINIPVTLAPYFKFSIQTKMNKNSSECPFPRSPLFSI